MHARTHRGLGSGAAADAERVEVLARDRTVDSVHREEIGGIVVVPVIDEELQVRVVVLGCARCESTARERPVCQ
jgi:hypothetical protein